MSKPRDLNEGGAPDPKQWGVDVNTAWEKIFEQQQADIANLKTYNGELVRMLADLCRNTNVDRERKLAEVKGLPEWWANHRREEAFAENLGRRAYERALKQVYRVGPNWNQLDPALQKDITEHARKADEIMLGAIRGIIFPGI